MGVSHEQGLQAFDRFRVLLPTMKKQKHPLRSAPSQMEPVALEELVRFENKQREFAENQEGAISGTLESPAMNIKVEESKDRQKEKACEQKKKLVCLCRKSLHCLVITFFGK